MRIKLGRQSSSTAKVPEIIRSILKVRDGAPELGVDWESLTCDFDCLHNLLVKELSNCRKLDVSSKGLGDEGIAVLGSALQGAVLVSLTHLDLTFNNFQGEGWQAIVNGMRRMRNLEVLTLARNFIRDQGSLAFAKEIEAEPLSKLQSLNLWKTGVMADGAAALGRGFEMGGAPLLKNLVMKDNRIGNVGMVGLCAAIACGKLPHLQILDVASCGIEFQGADALAQAIAEGNLRNLTHLYLSNNLICDAGTLVLIQAFSQTKAALTELWMQDVSMGVDGKVAMAEALEAQILPQLAKLVLLDRETTTQLSDEAFVSAYRRNNALTTELEAPFLSAVNRQNQRMFLKRNKGHAILMQKLGPQMIQARNGKVVLCGPAGAGKSTISESMQRNSFFSRLMNERRLRVPKRTRGIHTSRMKSKGEVSLNVNVWDLAGQQEYHVLHSAFLADERNGGGPATTFVVICRTDSSTREMEKQVKYWLRFISSNSVKGIPELRRDVVVVLNCIEGEPHPHADLWIASLLHWNDRFGESLRIHPLPFLLDGRLALSVKPLKDFLLQHTLTLLENRTIPKICDHVQSQLRRWMVGKEDFPILTWKEYAQSFSGSGMSSEQLEAALDFMHGAGQLVWFRQDLLIVLDPQWFCTRVVGQLLLPQGFLDEGDRPLKVCCDGSVEIAELEKYLRGPLMPNFGIEQVINMLSRLGLCYRLRDAEVLIPDLIAEDDELQLDHLTMSGNFQRFTDDTWVMGYSLVLKDVDTTLLPMALLRKLQVQLANDTLCNSRTDNSFAAGKNRITFKATGMSVAIQVSEVEAERDRIDILVTPLARSTDPKEDEDVRKSKQRRAQVDLAHNVLTKIDSDLLSDCCRGVEFVKAVIHPWSTEQGILPMRSRDVKTSVDEVVTWVQERGLGQYTNWTVGSERVREDELLPSPHLEALQQTFKDDTKFIEAFAILSDMLPDKEGALESNLQIGEEMNQSKLSLIRGTHSLRENQDPDAVMTAVADMRMEINQLKKVSDQRFGKLNTMLGGLKNIQSQMETMEAISVQERERKYPRFMFLARGDAPGKWVRLKDVFAKDNYKSIKLHLLCEMHHRQHFPHEVKGQEGLDLSSLPAWEQKVPIWFLSSMKIFLVAVRLAGVPLVSGFDSLVPDYQLFATSRACSPRVLDAIDKIITTAIAVQQRDRDQRVGFDPGPSRSSRKLPTMMTAKKPIQLNGTAMAAVDEVMRSLQPGAFERLFKLQRVKLKSSSGSVSQIVWICDDCKKEYGDAALPWSWLS